MNHEEYLKKQLQNLDKDTWEIIKKEEHFISFKSKQDDAYYRSFCHDEDLSTLINSETTKKDDFFVIENDRTPYYDTINYSIISQFGHLTVKLAFHHYKNDPLKLYKDQEIEINKNKDPHSIIGDSYLDEESIENYLELLKKCILIYLSRDHSLRLKVTTNNIHFRDYKFDSFFSRHSIL